MTDEDKAQRERLLIEFNDLYVTEENLITHGPNKERGTMAELEQIQDRLEVLRERISELSNDGAEVSYE